ncbi:ARM repeat-containing protein [Pluteus cervinus]|uniref:ARM repeat-containing protein n=1 Tax=Pluteus cervinus TaxID=181527 RepID=A0ACD3BCT0_9AGAR|nr:ARM repeat-containing protein [Pluteus cervinus]
MGNVQPGSILTRTTGALDSFVSELGADIIHERSLGSSRFLKTVRCRHRNGHLVIKIFIKPDPGVSLASYVRLLKMEREQLVDIANVYNYQTFVETDKAGYIIRQWIASNLYDRISTRPFLSLIEKKWIAFQLLNALRDARNRKVPHGDIKSENILVTSWNWVYLSDFASFKPTYLPLDDPSDYSFYFDTSGRRTCYLAPERFYTASDHPDIAAKKARMAVDDLEGRREGRVTEAMDCFSAGCVIAELFLEGAPLFTLSQLFKYRDKEYSVDSQLASIEDEGVRNIIKQMINLEPSNRPTFDTLLHTSRGTVFPEMFYSFLHNYVSSINDLPTSTPFSVASPNPTLPAVTPSTIAPSISGASIRTTQSIGQQLDAATSADLIKDPLPSDSDHRIERIWADYESVESYLTPEAGEHTVMDVRVEYGAPPSMSKPFQDILPVELLIPNKESKLQSNPSGTRAAREDGPALIILALVTANVRDCSLPSSKLRALDVFLALSCHLTDEAKLDRMVPYVIDLLHDDSPVVRSSALRTLMQVLILVKVVTPSNVAIFSEYIIPNIKHLVTDPEVSVRSTYAQCITQLADTAVRYLEMGQALKAHGTLKLTTEVQDLDAHYEVSYEVSLQDLQMNIQEHLSALLMDPSSVVRRAVLHDISSLCIFLGRQRTNDVLLSHMITYLNDRDWLLRYAFFESIVDVAACAGGRSLEEYILPLMVQALSDVEENVVAKVLAALISLCELGLFQKMRIWELMSASLGFLYHPNIWIRQGTVGFIASAAKQLPTTDVWCILYPSLRHFLKSDIVTIDEPTLLAALKPPLPRQILDAAVQWAMKADKSMFWRVRRGIKAESPKDSVMAFRKAGNALSRNKSEEDDVHITKLQQLGMTSSEETKLLAMRDYIMKLANATSSFASRLSSEPEPEKNLKVLGDLELQKLGVVPQTVFLKPRPSETPRPSRVASARLSRAVLDTAGRTPIVSPPRLMRIPSIDHINSGAPFEDLRRRLVSINSSAGSLTPVQPAMPLPSPRSTLSMSPSNAPPMSPLGTNPVTTISERPSSPTESVVSTANSSTFRPLSRMQIGNADGQKAAPLIGSSKANAIGVLDAHYKLRSDGSPERSGRSSPTSTTLGHRAPRLRPPSWMPISTYDGQDLGISNLLENLYLDNNKELQQDFGPKVHEGPVRRRNPVRHTFPPRDGSQRKTEATLIANLTSHSDAITALAVSPDHMFFVSSSNDHTVKVWDTARLERNVTSKPRHTYGQHHEKVKCVCILEGVHCFASAAVDGSLHVVRVQTTQTGALPKYNKLHVVREHRVENPGEYVTCMTHFNTESASNLVYATTHSNITTLDLRTMRVLQNLENPRHYGPITSMCVDRKRSWIVVGTSTGVLTLWDRRFGLLLKSWHVSAAAGGKGARVHQIVLHPSKGRGKWIMVAAETSKRQGDKASITLIEVWDIEKAVLVESYVTRLGGTTETSSEPQEVQGVEADPSPAAAIAALVRSRQAGGSSLDKRPRLNSRGNGKDEVSASPSPDIRSLVVGLDFGGYSAQRPDLNEVMVDSNSSIRTAGRGFMIGGSEDRKLRLWDIGRVERSTVLSGLESENDKPVYSTQTAETASTFVETWPPNAAHSNRAPQRMSLITHTQQNLLKSHQDVISALACIDAPFRGGIISGDRAGSIKVWRVDYAEQQ